MEKPATLMRLLSYLQAYRGLVIKTIVILCFATGFEVLGPLLIKKFIDDHLVPKNFALLPLLLLALFYLATNLIAAVLSYLQGIQLGQIAQHVVRMMRLEIQAKILHLPLKRFDYTPTGSLISRITNDTESVKELFMEVLSVYVRNSIRIIGVLTVMAILNVKLMLICFVFVPMVLFVMAFYRRYSAPVFQRARALLSDINSRLNESLQGVSVIQLFNQQQRFKAHFYQITEKHYLTRLRNMQLDSILLRPMVDLLHLFTLASLLYVFGRQSLTASLEVGLLYAFVSYLARFTEPLVEMTQRLSFYQQAIVSAARVYEWIDLESESFSGNEKLVITDAHIEIKDVSFSYDGEQQVISHVTANIKPGQFVGIVGYTGSGKSTLASLLMRFYAVQEGEIVVDGQLLECYAAPELRKHFALVQQDSFILADTIFNNIDIGRNLPAQRIEAAAKAVGLHDEILSLAQGYHTVMAERGSNLSHGQRQLLSLARAIAGEPKVLLLDEATANVDSETEQKVQQALLQLKQKTTIIAIAHRLSTITQADNIVVMHQGKIAEMGTHLTLLAQDGLYKHLYQLQREAKVLLEY